MVKYKYYVFTVKKNEKNLIINYISLSLFFQVFIVFYAKKLKKGLYKISV